MPVLLPRSRAIRVLALLVVAVTSVSCSGGGDEAPGTTQPPAQPPAATVSSVLVASFAQLTVGATVQASATARDASGATINGRTVTWSSTNSAVASVNASGLVTAVAPGTSEIAASVDGVSGRSSVSVVAVPVSSVTVAALSSTLAGSTAQATATVRNSSGGALTGRTVTWSTGSAAIATVNASGLVTGVAAGTTDVIATSEGITGRASIEIVNPSNIPFFDSPPFAVAYVQGNLLDHDIPKEFVDANGTFTTFWGEVLANSGNMTDGHSGYDWNLPTGTPLLAVAAGRVARVDESSVSFFCPPLNANVSNQKSVFLELDLPGGIKIRPWYTHLSETRVTVGQTVTAGQVIGLAGNTGCSTAPHLHFEVFRVVTSNPLVLRTIDPYGWSGAGVDPWSIHPDGAVSIQLWKPGVAPDLTKISVNNFTANTPASAQVVSRIAFMGVDDARNLNNEFFEVALDSRVAASVSLDGMRIRADRSLLNYAIPAGITLNAARPTVRFYTGTGTNTSSAIYMGRTVPTWSNVGDDCGRLVNTNGAQYRWNLGNGCPLPGPAIQSPMVQTERTSNRFYELHAPMR